MGTLIITAKMFMKCHFCHEAACREYHMCRHSQKSVDYWDKNKITVSYLQAKWISDNLLPCSQSVVIPPNWTPVFLLFLLLLLDKLWQGELRLPLPALPCTLFIVSSAIRCVPSTKREMLLYKPQKIEHYILYCFVDKSSLEKWTVICEPTLKCFLL